jgi:hypothetical protein
MARLNVRDYLKDIHKGQDIYVIASGASMDYVDPSFFEGKITIGLNQTFSKYKYCTYYLRKDGRGWMGFDVIDHINNVSPQSKLIVSDYVGCALEWGKNDFGDDIGFDYYYFDHPTGHGELDTSVLPKILPEAIFPNGVSLTSIGIAMAAYMGAKNIIVCGNDTVLVDGKDYFKEYTQSYKKPQDHVPDLNWGSPQSEIVTKYLRELGINIVGFNPWINFRLEGHRCSL